MVAALAPESLMNHSNLVECPKCHKSDTVGSDLFGSLSFDLTKGHLMGNISVQCRDCDARIPITIDQLLLSDSPYYQLIGFVGPGAVTTPIDAGSTCESVTIMQENGSQATLNVGEITIGRTDGAGRQVSSQTVKIGVKPEFLVTPGELKKYSLGGSYDQVLWVHAFLKEPVDLREHVVLHAWVERGMLEASDTLNVVSSVDSLSSLSSTTTYNVVCKICGVIHGTNLRPWCGMFLEAITNARNGMFETACLQYARSCESFVDDFLMESLVKTEMSTELVAETLMTKMWSIGERLNRLMYLVIEENDGYAHLVDEWKRHVEKPRNSVSAHGSGSVRRVRESDNRSVDAQGARQAHEAAFALIRGLQLRCRFEDGKDWEHWLKNTVPMLTRSENEEH